MNPAALPPEASTKLRNLALQAQDCEVLAATTLKALELAQNRMGDAQNQADSASDDIRRERATKEVESLKRQAEHLGEVHARRQAEHALAAQSLARVTDWVATLPDQVRLETAPTAFPGLLEGQSQAQALETVRQQIAELERDLAETRHAPLPREDLRILCARHVDARARRGRPRLRTDPRQSLVIEWGNPQAWSTGSIDETIDALCWLDSGKMADRLLQELDHQIRTDGGLSAGEREQRIDQLNENLDRLSREEESLVELSGAARRLGAAPMAILGVRILARQQEVAAA